MRAGFDDVSAVDHEDAIGLLDRRQSMCDDERRAVVHQLIERPLDDALGFGVQRRRRFVENQDRRILEQRARDRDALPLPARQQHAAIAHHRVQSGRQFARELQHVRRTRGFLDRRR